MARALRVQGVRISVLGLLLMATAIGLTIGLWLKEKQPYGMLAVFGVGLALFGIGVSRLARTDRIRRRMSSVPFGDTTIMLLAPVIPLLLLLIFCCPSLVGPATIDVGGEYLKENRKADDKDGGNQFAVHREKLLNHDLCGLCDLCGTRSFGHRGHRGKSFRHSLRLSGSGHPVEPQADPRESARIGVNSRRDLIATSNG